MTREVLRIATRESPLAMWQAEYVGQALEKSHQGLRVELLPMTTRGDQILDAPLAKIGGKGLFMKELEVALLENRADIAVHSMKDVPMYFPAGLGLGAICAREDCRDAFVASDFSSFDDLPEGAVVGSSSLRRQCQLKALRPDIAIRNLRGNVNTRLRKLEDGEYHAIILAAAGLKRLGMADRIRAYLPAETCLPAGGQGAVGIECRSDDRETLALLAPLNHRATSVCVMAERAMNTLLNGGCQVPVACLAQLSGTAPGEILTIRGLVGEPDGSHIIRGERTGPAGDGITLGEALAQDLLDHGAGDILARLDVG